MVKIKKSKIKEVLDVIIISLLYFVNFGIANNENLQKVLVILGISTLYSIFIILSNRIYFYKIIKKPIYCWITINFIMMFIYGYFGVKQDAFSLKFHLFNYCIILNLMIIMFKNNNFISLLYRVSILSIFLLGIVIFKEESKDIYLFFSGNFNRIGNSLVGNVNTSAMAFGFLLIPICYYLFVKQRYTIIGIVALIIGLFFVLVSGSKKSILYILIIYIYSLFLKKTKLNQKISVLFFSVMMTLLLALNYSKLDGIFERFIKMFYDILNYQETSASSTNLRIRFIKTTLIKFWDKPIFGHGWDSFSRLYGYVDKYEKNLYTHCNYTEILFSFGIVGFLIYYLYPINLLIKAKKMKKEIKILLNFYLLNFFFLDIAAVTFYHTLTGVILLLVINIIIEKNKSYNLKNDLGD